MKKNKRNRNQWNLANEGALYYAVTLWLRDHNIKFWHVPADVKKQSLEGMPDMIILAPKNIIYIELKNPTKPLSQCVISKAQSDFMEYCDKRKVPHLLTNDIMHAINFIEKYL